MCMCTSLYSYKGKVVQRISTLYTCMLSYMWVILYDMLAVGIIIHNTNLN